jgi:hypothetical protein
MIIRRKCEEEEKVGIYLFFIGIVISTLLPTPQLP